MCLDLYQKANNKKDSFKRGHLGVPLKIKEIKPELFKILLLNTALLMLNQNNTYVSSSRLKKGTVILESYKHPKLNNKSIFYLITDPEFWAIYRLCKNHLNNLYYLFQMLNPPHN